MFRKIFFVCLALLSTSALAQTTRYVTLSGNGNKTGSSWENASNDIQMMINASAVNDQVFVGIGRYVPKYTPQDGQNFSATPADPRDKAFVMKNGVKLYGGFDPENNIKSITDARIVPDKTVTPIVRGTILSGDLNGDDGLDLSVARGNQKTNIADNTYHIVLGLSSTENVKVELDGFTITGANADGSESYLVNGIGISRYVGGPILANVRPPSLTTNVILKNCGVNNNTALSNSGGITATSEIHCEISITNSSINNNSSQNGGGIYANSTSEPSTIIVTNSTVSNNKSSYDGGGIYVRAYNSSSVITIADSDINNNSASTTGGGIYAYGNVAATVTLSGSNINNNSSLSEGGGIYARAIRSSSSVELTNSNVNGNTSTAQGGGIFVQAEEHNLGSSVILTNSSVNNNSISNSYSPFGGGIYISAVKPSIVTLTNSTVNNNSINSSSSAYGGGIYVSSSTGTINLTLTNSSVNNNSVSSNGEVLGGGIYAAKSSYELSLSTLTLTGSSVSNNVVSANSSSALGGGIYVKYIPTMKLTNSVINNNSLSTTSAAKGAGIYCYNLPLNVSSLNLINSTLASNKGNSYIYFAGGEATDEVFNVENSIIFGNKISATNTTESIMEILNAGFIKNIKYSLVQGESSTTNGNLDGTSASYTLVNLFTDAVNGNYTLKNGSAAINAGSNQLYTAAGGVLANDKDLAGNTRVFDHTIDMGAYENQTVQALPVNFGEFTATKQTNNVKLSWNTFSESNNKGFMVQKSTDGKSFSDLAFVESRSAAANNYTLLDGSPANGANYYRLIQQDIDGEQTELGTKVVNYVLANADVKAWPNPVSNMLNISFAAGKYQEITLLDVSGKTLQRLPLTSNQSVAQLDLAVYAKGVYVLQLKGGEGAHQIKVLK